MKCAALAGIRHRCRAVVLHPSSLHTSFTLHSSLFTLRRLGAALLISISLLLASRRVFAHPLDEYVQATYVTLGTDSIKLDLALNPGVLVAERVLALIDLDRDGEVSAAEARAYAESVVRDLQLSLDGHASILTLDTVEFPPVGSLLQGNGMIRLSVRSSAVARTGEHLLSYYNSHEPLPSAYLATAYLPDDPISITGQTRDWYQHGIEIRYTVASPGWLLPLWIALGAASMGAFFVLRWRIRRASGASSIPA